MVVQHHKIKYHYFTEQVGLILESKSKGFLLQAWCGSWGSRRIRLLDHLDIRHYGGGKVVTLMHRPSLPPGVFLVLIFRGWVDRRAHSSIGSFGKNPQRHHRGFVFVLCTLTVLLCPGFAFCPYCTTHTTQTFMPPAGFEPAIPASDWP